MSEDEHAVAAESPANNEVAEQEDGVAVSSFAELLYLSTVRVLTSRDQDAPHAGSAFVVADEGSRFLVTAAHLVRNTDTSTIHVYTASRGPRFGAPAQYQIRRQDEFWHFHTDPDVDIAVGAFDEVADFLGRENRDLTINAISTTDFVPRWEDRRPTFTDPFWHPLPLDEVLLVGYPEDYRDRETSLPLLRRGRLATPIWLNHEGRPVFLVDTYAGRGTSGGPVAYVEEKHHIGNTMYGDTGKIVLLGVFSEVLPAGRRIAIQDGQPGQPPNLGAAYKAHLINEVIATFGR
jgi:hypothetical protein